MNIEQKRLPSPSLSAATTARSTPRSTQEPTSIEDRLRHYEISEDDENRWKKQYNRASLPLMRDDLFSKLLINIAGDTHPATVEFESKLKSAMEQKSINSQTEFNDQAYKIMLDGAALFENSQILDFLSILDEEPTVYGVQAFVARCLPLLIDGHRKRKSKRGPKQKKPSPPRVSKLSSESTGGTGIRQSNRVKTPNATSTGKDGRRRSNRINQLHAPLGSID